MKPFTTKILVIIIAAAIIAPTAYFAYEYYNKTNVTQFSQPYAYMPGNSTMIASAHQNGTQYFIFEVSSQFGIVANISSIQNINSTLHSKSGISPEYSTSSGNIGFLSGSNVSTSTYDHITLYEIKNVNLSALLGNIINSNITGIQNNRTINIYAYITSNNYVVIGEINAVHDSILAHSSNKTALKYRSYLNQNDNISLYYNLSSIQKLQYLTLNSTSNITTMHITGNISEFDASFIQNILNLTLGNITHKVTRSSTGITITMNGGYSYLGNLIKKLK
ncbi:MAG: hypothetical protein QXZ44_05600 [Ferroplasma sp.]